ncbi:T9SS type A sorting domain-containing protein [Flavihumibacter profundi]|jgi:hypothetical protein|uniref:T9SS type A sorting domain-containing protein n=1 Tax=Flavihumibacter profundi TaxID=2716883 RepID=UPI001CC52F90|nr:T9SS type A sorting domain-containing protein [Flavihumibacter profundi]MBZ5857243.1 T9SS type A sorting domain-containing protein [Flavihumibacter profundi]
MNCRCLVLLCLLSLEAGAEIRWTGVTGNGLWADPGNWENGILPGNADDVILDNSLLAADYTVRLPDFAVTVRSLQVVPGPFNAIIAELPITNLVSSASGSLAERALTTTGNGYSLIIGRGAVFINASGSSSGYSLRLNDSLRVDNGGTYIHRTRTGHAELVQFLSRKTGTENGVFRFENTDAASIVSLSGRVYGSLQLSAAATANGTTTYSASGTNPVIIRGDLALEQGVSFAINLDDTIMVSGNLVMNNAVFNMASGNRSSVLQLAGDWLQTGGAIAETNLQQKTGTILLQGSALQKIQCTGGVTDSIIVVLKNKAGAILQNPLSLPYILKLDEGILTTSTTQLLTIGARGVVKADSSILSSYINGPIKKIGLANSYFLFPVGRNGSLRWLSLQNASGDITAEYHPGSAYAIGNTLDPALDHISKLEYWSLLGESATVAHVGLSFNNELSGGVSDLASLRVAAWSGGQWNDAGNQATTGAASGDGSVVSILLNGVGVSGKFFTLASSSSLTNVLPVLMEMQWMDQKLDRWFCNWKVDGNPEADYFAIELSGNGLSYNTVAEVKAIRNQQLYQQVIPAMWKSGFCRIRVINRQGSAMHGDVMRFGQSYPDVQEVSVLHPAGTNFIQFNSDRERVVAMQLLDQGGRIIVRDNLRLHPGVTGYTLSGISLPPGIYFLQLKDKQGQVQVKKLFF